ncbi:MAG: sensor histidine kinase [Lachnospiraceae bacterium]
MRLEGEKMKKEKKQLSLNAKIIITCFFMVIVPNILIFCSLMGIKGYFEATMGSAFRDKVDPSILRFFIMDTLISVIIILVICMLVVRRYVYKEIVRPISELNVAMKKIAEGNLDYRMENKYDSEMGEVFNNYEEMRLKLKESTTEMMENEEHNRELVSNISHDLKTPITSIKGYVEGIMDGVADTPEKMDRYIKTIYNKANDMDRLINELTIYSKIDNNRILYNFQRINVSEYFEDCVDEVGLDLESKNIKLNFDNLIPDDTIVIADPEQMKRVINNIIGNSIKYMDKDLTKEQGMIEIRLLDDIDSIRIEIEDNGRGIAARDLGRIFERFYRTDASRNSSRGGSGIGLSIVKKIIEDHGGYIWATSKEGEGTCMHFVLRKYKEVDDDE